MGHDTSLDRTVHRWQPRRMRLLDRGARHRGWLDSGATTQLISVRRGLAAQSLRGDTRMNHRIATLIDKRQPLFLTDGGLETTAQLMNDLLAL